MVYYDIKKYRRVPVDDDRERDDILNMLACNAYSIEVVEMWHDEHDSEWLAEFQATREEVEPEHLPEDWA
jgi:hypothetical protein